ncbi:YceD family protein [Paenibacillus sp. DS2015]|uniref:YceD family protein n=1 Tax=Paenibacillus sp. DS2015 TaxID=3373917 RepID=UPI003D1E1CFC
MMHFEFRQMVKMEGPLQIHETVDIDRAVEGRRDIIAASPVHADLQATFLGTDLIDSMVEVQGKLTGHVDMVCSRCLTSVHEQLEIPFHEHFKLVKQSEELQDEDDETIYVDHDMVDLIPFVEETFLLYLPLIPLCKSSCKGLCQTCGTDLNQSSCNCDTRVVDPRLAGLKDLFFK